MTIIESHEEIDRWLKNKYNAEDFLFDLFPEYKKLKINTTN